MARTVFHTTRKGNGKLITENGWEVTYAGWNIYGRGIYFWDLMDDAHRYGKERFDGVYDIVSEDIPITPSNSVTYDHAKAASSHIDSIAKGLLSRGIDVIIISNPQIAQSTLSRAKGKAYLWLVDIDDDVRIVRR